MTAVADLCRGDVEQRCVGQESYSANTGLPVVLSAECGSVKSFARVYPYPEFPENVIAVIPFSQTGDIVGAD